MTAGSEFNINKVWDFIESKPFNNKDYSPMFSTAKEIYDKFGEKELEMYTNFQWNGRDTPIHRKELANLQRIKTMDGASKMRETKINESNVICFNIINSELAHEVNSNKFLLSKLETKRIKGKEFFALSPEIYDKFSDFALSRGYNNSEDFWEVDDEGKEADTDWTDGKFHMKENSMNTQQLTKFTKYIKSYLNSKGYDVHTIYNDKRSTGSRRIKIMGRARLSDQEENKIVSELEDKFRKIPDIKFWFGGHFFVELPTDINVSKLPTMENKMKKLTVEQKAKVIKFAKKLVENSNKFSKGGVVSFSIMDSKMNDAFQNSVFADDIDYDREGNYTLTPNLFAKFEQWADDNNFGSPVDYREIMESKKMVGKKIIKENNNYTMISALREIADDLLLQTELLIDRQYGKVEHDAFKNQWYKTANEFEKKFKTIIKSLMKSGQ